MLLKSREKLKTLLYKCVASHMKIIANILLLFAVKIGVTKRIFCGNGLESLNTPVHDTFVVIFFFYFASALSQLHFSVYRNQSKMAIFRNFQLSFEIKW